MKLFPIQWKRKGNALGYICIVSQMAANGSSAFSCSNNSIYSSTRLRFIFIVAENSFHCFVAKLDMCGIGVENVLNRTLSMSRNAGGRR